MVRILKSTPTVAMCDVVNTCEMGVSERQAEMETMLQGAKTEAKDKPRQRSGG